MNSSLTSSEHWLLVDDHAMFADALSLTLQHHMPTLQVDVANTAHNALATLRAGRHYQCIFIDLDLPDSPGLTLLDQILKRWPQSIVLICSANRQPAVVTNAQQMGARGYISKDQSPLDILSFVQRIRQGQRWVTSDSITRELAEQPESPFHLTARQLGILQQMHRGLNTSEIAAELNLSPNTIKTHTRLMYGKLNASNRTECLNRALSLGLL
ncbi:response regulator transcription factor [Saccharospirillum alexandrii]|uniref:response regulator transcription factor n=1 Tax=Saccharospirillum alexandrii TaxID=2448477 RepID=UPI0013DF452B|nr:response regulator transcription factor [Saccharospirillum alexandrii]